MNVLLTSVGRRAYMVKYFKEALESDGKVFVCNSEETIAFRYADKSCLTPLIYDEEYIPFLLKYCSENKVEVLLSLFDMDLLILAQHKKEFENIGTRIIVSDENIVQICNDKWKTYKFLKENNFYVPQTYCSLYDVQHALKNEQIKFPIIIKPRFGCGSISILSAYDQDELLYLTQKVNREIGDSYLKYESAIVTEKIIYQECLQGQEYGADIINDLEGEFRNIIIRKKIAMRAGETDIAEIVQQPMIEKELTRLAKLTRHIANMDCDIFMVNGKPYILELNARFGGGYPFSHVAGCNLPKAIVKWHKGERIPLDMLQAKCGIRAYKELVITTIN